MRQFGELEAVIMDRLWEWGRPALVREVVDDLSRDRSIAYTTVMTVMENLHRKGWLRRQRDGRAWRYEPTGSRSGERLLPALAPVMTRAEVRQLQRDFVVLVEADGELDTGFRKVPQTGSAAAAIAALVEGWPTMPRRGVEAGSRVT